MPTLVFQRTPLRLASLPQKKKKKNLLPYYRMKFRFLILVLEVPHNFIIYLKLFLLLLSSVYSFFLSTWLKCITCCFWKTPHTLLSSLFDYAVPVLWNTPPSFSACQELAILLHLYYRSPVCLFACLLPLDILVGQIWEWIFYILWGMVSHRPLL